MQKRTLITIPAYNEENNLAQVVNEIKAINPTYDIVVVDDGSQDRTAQIAKDLNVSLIRHPINLGYGVAIQTGLKYAVINKYDLILFIDGDGQHDPREAIKLIDAIEKYSVDVVIGSRYFKKNAYRTPVLRKIGITFFSLLTCLITGKKIMDITSGFQALNREAAIFLAEEYPSDFPDAEIIILLALSGFKLLEVPVHIRPRLSGRSMYSFLRSIYYPFKVLIAILAVMLRFIFVTKRRT